MSRMLIVGGCHCGSLRFELDWPAAALSGETLVIPGRRCSCTFCTRLDGVWTSHPDASLTIFEDPAHPARAYQFGTGTADFLFCSRCGIAPLVTCELESKTYAVVNVNTFSQEQETALEIEQGDTDFDGESTGQRLDRRKARWIGKVKRTGR